MRAARFSRSQEMITKLLERRIPRRGVILLVGILLVAFAPAPILRQVAAFLVIEDPLRPALAIVALAGQTPFREMEAARLYHTGLAPQVIIVGVGPSAESKALEEQGFKIPQTWELSREVLIQRGIPATAIIVRSIKAGGTLEELRAVYGAITDKAAPVILVTSKFHTRRTRLIWSHVSEGRSQPIVRAASQDPFDPNNWWKRRSFALSVVREYLGLANHYLGVIAAP